MITVRSPNPATRVCWLAFAFLVLIAAVECSSPATAATPAPQKRSQRSRPRRPKVPPAPQVDYTKFSHTTHAVAQKLACDSCHKVPSKNWKEFRKGDAAFPDVTDFPEHSSCLSCHRTQFFARERPAPAICSNCHIAVTPRDTARWLFPSLGDVTDPKLRRRDFASEFGVGFPHDKHIEVVGFNLTPPKRATAWSATVAVAWRQRAGASEALAPQKPAPPKSCPVCHETYKPQGNSSEEYVVPAPRTLGDAFWLKKGTFKTIPNSHTICFTCHNADSGIPPEPKDCNTCHKLMAPLKLKTDFDPKLAANMGVDQMMLARWSRRISAGAFRHEAGEHPDLSCLNCHNAASATFNPVDPITLKVPVRSCGGAEGCHITATADDGGAMNFEIDARKKDPKFVCSKCHVTFGAEPVPASHAQAIPTPKPKQAS